jgi:hypothetical protein
VNQGNRKLSQIFAWSAINVAFDVQCLGLRPQGSGGEGLATPRFALYVVRTKPLVLALLLG